MPPCLRTRRALSARTLDDVPKVFEQLIVGSITERKRLYF
jgi:hypothetical protein